MTVDGPPYTFSWFSGPRNSGDQRSLRVYKCIPRRRVDDRRGNVQGDTWFSLNQGAYARLAPSGRPDPACSEMPAVGQKWGSSDPDDWRLSKPSSMDPLRWARYESDR